MTASYFLEKTKPKSAGEHAREEFLGLANVKQKTVSFNAIIVGIVYTLQWWIDGLINEKACFYDGDPVLNEAKVNKTRATRARARRPFIAYKAKQTISWKQTMWRGEKVLAENVGG